MPLPTIKKISKINVVPHFTQSSSLSDTATPNPTPSTPAPPPLAHPPPGASQSLHLEAPSPDMSQMVLLEKLWDDVVAGPQPERGLGMLRKLATPLKIPEGSSKYQRSVSMPASPGTPATPTTPSTPLSAKKDNVWRSVFNPGSNLATKGIGAAKFDKPEPNTPTVYDWLYSGETRSKHHR
uniref:Auxin-repressed protein n=1 Tax=Kalanchoe fedtschenkoi TaxID=63787 RepID=A0A7N0TKC5_KALFE